MKDLNIVDLKNKLCEQKTSPIGDFQTPEDEDPDLIMIILSLSRFLKKFGFWMTGFDGFPWSWRV